MAQVGLLSSVVMACVIAGCGGKLGSDTASAGDSGVDAPSDTPPQVEGWHSYVATVTASSVDWMGGPEPADKKEVAVGATFRFDVRVGSGGIDVVISAPYRDSIAMHGCCGDVVTLTTAPSAFFDVGGASTYGSLHDTFDAMQLTLDASGRPVSASMTGRAEYIEGDYGSEGSVSATVAFADDAKGPEFRASSNRAFASVPLPWDERIYEASEPYEAGPTFAQVVGDGLAPIAVGSVIAEDGWGEKKARGVRFTAKSWDGAAHWLVKPTVAPRDLAGNAAIVTPGSFEGAIDVPRTTSAHVHAGESTFASWGTATITSSGCKSGSKCVALGPFTWSACAGGSAAGIALRLTGSGKTTASVRATAKVMGSTYGGGPGVPIAVQLEAAQPGGARKAADATLAWPTSPASDGTLDTGWGTLSVALPPGASETGVAISGGGTGAYHSSCGFLGGPPVPETYEVTVYVDEVSTGM